MNIQLGITSNHLWSIFSLAIIFFIVTVSVLLHHWNYYGIKGNGKIFVKSLFFFGALIMLIAMVVLIVLYSMKSI